MLCAPQGKDPRVPGMAFDPKTSNQTLILPGLQLVLPSQVEKAKMLSSEEIFCICLLKTHSFYIAFG